MRTFHVSARRGLAALSLLFLLCARGKAAILDAADGLFEKGLYQEALRAYAPVLKDQDSETRFKALYRSLECEVLLFRYGQAVERYQKLQPPKAGLMKARWLIAGAELGREFLKQYGHGSPRDEEENSSDITRRAPQEWHQEIRAAYRKLWDMRAELISAPLKDEAYYVDLKAAETQTTPTLWDFVVLRWINYLLDEVEQGSLKRPSFDSVAAPRYAVPFSDENSPVLQAASIYEESERLQGPGRSAVRGLWQIRRVLIPFQYPHLVESPPDYPERQRRTAELLADWMSRAGEALPRAQAGLESARLWNQAGEYARGVELCRSVEKNWPGTRAARHCAKLRAQIELPELDLSAQMAPPPGKDMLALRTRNLDNVALRVYRLDPEAVAAVAPGVRRDWGALRRPEDGLVRSVLARAPDHAWIAATSTTVPHAHQQTFVSPPELKPGFYLAVASSDPGFAWGKNLVSAAFLNVTDLFLVVSAGPQGTERDFLFDPHEPHAVRRVPGFHLYGIDALNGEPRSARVEAHKGLNWDVSQRLSLQLDESGLGQVDMDVRLSHGEPTNVFFDALARSSGSFAFGSGPVHFWHSVPAPVEIHVETDRPIYRPGQEVSAKITVLRRVPSGLKVYDGLSTIELKANDPNYNEIFKTTLTLGPMGSASTRFVVPPGRLLGGYHLYAQLKDFGHDFSGSAGFSVEEYKRPEFEVLVQESSASWKYGESVLVKGEARYYFGGPVPLAPVSIKIFREIYIPWFCWWWRGFAPESPRQEVFSGETKTDDKGLFSLAFIPRPEMNGPKEPWPTTFTVEAESRDPGGRTITGSRTFRAGAKAVLFEITPPSGFFTAGGKAQVKVRLMNLNEQAVDGEAEFELFRMPAPAADNQENNSGNQWLLESPSLEHIYKDTPNGTKTAYGKLTLKEGRPVDAGLGNLPEGAYRLQLKTKDAWGEESAQSVILLAAGSERGRTGLELPAAAIAEQASFLPGETARILLGSTFLTSGFHVEVWTGDYLLERRWIPGGGVQVIGFPVTEDHKGGFTVRWFGAVGFRIRGGQVFVDVPWRDKELSVKLNHEKVMKPGAMTSGSLEVLGSDKKPVSGEAVVRVFDRSLEYYVSAAQSWLLDLYQPRRGAGQAQGSLFSLTPIALPVTEGWIKALLDLYREYISEPSPPQLRLNKSRVYGRRRHDMVRMMPAAAAPQEMMAEGSSFAKAKSDGPSSLVMDQKKQAAEPAAVRSEFADTAYFEPHLRVVAGRGAFSFKAPEQLTGWNVQAAVLTSDVKRGLVAEQAVTRKDLMVRVELPRFLREGDLGTVKAVVHNETDSELSGEVSLSASEDDKPSSEIFGQKDLSRSFTAKPHGLSSFSWPVQAPSRQTTYKIRAVARAGNLVDAEEREIPILPSRQRLIETSLLALNGTADKTLKLPSFDAADTTLRHESVHMQIDPQVALSILNSLPFLVKYPHECTEQLLHRYVPLAITNAFYRKHPALASAAGKIPRRDTATPAWDRADPRRLTAFMETPWEELSRGRSSPAPLIDMLDPGVVRHELGDALEKLKSTQNGDGSFPWFPGGRPDPYMTLLYLAGMAEAQRYGVEAPLDSVRRALAYVNSEIPRRLKPDPGSLSLILYAAYVVTSYPRSIPESELGYRFAKAWADFADKHAGALTPLGKAYAAFVYTRLGEKAKGGLYLDRALDGAREDPLTGVYWTPEKISWLWYNDSVETHAFLLRALLSLRPQDRLIPGMVQWLLFNRKGTEWKSTKASAAAIYSLLDVLKSRGSLEKGDSYKVLWGEDVHSAQVSAADWLATPMRWSKYGAEVGPRHGSARIEKQGPGLAFASLTWIYTTDKPTVASGPGPITLSRRFFSRRKEGDVYRLKPLTEGAVVAVGDQIEVQLKINARGQFEYLHLKDPKLAGFEAEELLSGWKWDQLSRYEEQRDSLANFFMDWTPHGEYTLRYRLRPTLPGSYRLGAAVLQSMYAPEISARSDSYSLNVRD